MNDAFEYKRKMLKSAIEHGRPIYVASKNVIETTMHSKDPTVRSSPHLSVNPAMLELAGQPLEEPMFYNECEITSISTKHNRTWWWDLAWVYTIDNNWEDAI